MQALISFFSLPARTRMLALGLTALLWTLLFEYGGAPASLAVVAAFVGLAFLTQGAAPEIRMRVFCFISDASALAFCSWAALSFVQFVLSWNDAKPQFGADAVAAVEPFLALLAIALVFAIWGFFAFQRNPRDTTGARLTKTRLDAVLHSKLSLAVAGSGLLMVLYGVLVLVPALAPLASLPTADSRFAATWPFVFDFLMLGILIACSTCFALTTLVARAACKDSSLYLAPPVYLVILLGVMMVLMSSTRYLLA